MSPKSLKPKRNSQPARKLTTNKEPAALVNQGPQKLVLPFIKRHLGPQLCSVSAFGLADIGHEKWQTHSLTDFLIPTDFVQKPPRTEAAFSPIGNHQAIQQCQAIMKNMH